MATPHIIHWHQIRTPNRELNPDHGDYDFRFLAEGDSWFTIGGIPQWNVLRSLDLPNRNILVSLARPGDTLLNMADLANNSDLKHALSTRHGYRWNAILLSAGGNDLIDYAPDLVKSPQERPATTGNPADYVHQARLREVLDYLQEGFRRIVAQRDQHGGSSIGKPIIVHTYDHATPIDAPARLGPITLGPWLYPTFVDDQVPQSDWIALSDYLVDHLAEAILDLGQNGDHPLPNFHVVDTRGTLVRAELGATGESNDWLNEIHPTKPGYDKVAAKISAKLNSLV